MACGIYTIGGIPLGCLDNTGGIKYVDIAPMPTDGAAYDLASDSMSIETINDPIASEFKRFSFRKQTSGLESTVNINDVEGIMSVTTNLTLKFAKQETAKRSEIMALLLENSIVVVTDMNDKQWVLGVENPVTATAGTTSTGINLTDGNSYNITLTDLSSELPYELTGSIATS